MKTHKTNRFIRRSESTVSETNRDSLIVSHLFASLPSSVSPFSSSSASSPHAHAPSVGSSVMREFFHPLIHPLTHSLTRLPSHDSPLALSAFTSPLALFCHFTRLSLSLPLLTHTRTHTLPLSPPLPSSLSLLSSRDSPLVPLPSG